MGIVSVAKPQADRERVLRAAESLGLIGSAADSAVRLMGQLCDVRASGSDIALLIENHPVLCVRVLRVANSAYYGQPRSITTVKQAVVLLGTNSIRGIAAAACIDRATPRRTVGDVADMSALLRHSLATAVAAEGVARVSRHHSLAAEAFVAGVLHHLGVAVQFSIDRPGIHAMTNALRRDPNLGIRALESQFAAIPHEDCVSIILREWQLPDSLVAAAGCHHDPAAAPVAHRQLATLLSLGTTLALSCGNTFSLEPHPPREAELQQAAETAARLGIDAERLHKITLELPEKVESLSSALFGS